MIKEILKSKIQQIFEKQKIANIDSIESISENKNYETYLINKQYLFKLSNDQLAGYLLRDKLIITNILRKKSDFPIQKIICTKKRCNILPRPYQIQEAKKGESIKEIYDYLDIKEKNQIAKELGKTISDLHSIRTKYSGAFSTNPEFAPINGMIIGKWTDYNNKLFLSNINELATIQEINKITLKSHTKFFETYKDLLELNFKPSIIHNNLNNNTIHVEKNNISSITDFDKTIAGDKTYELASLEDQLFKNYPELKPQFYSTYLQKQEITENHDALINFYRFLNQVNNIANNHMNYSKQEKKEQLETIQRLVDEQP